jgi:soluble lytic murein transglycosylase-like protein
MAAFVALSSTTVASEPPDLIGTHWELAAKQAGVDPLMLYAVALTESGRTTGEGRITPWPWTLNVEGRAYFAETKKEAAALLASNRGRSVDVGLLQVNTRWHGHRVDDVEALLEPAINLEIGAAILEEALATAPGDLTTGIGRYHSVRLEHARPYARTVLSFYRFLLHHEETERALP